MYIILNKSKLIILNIYKKKLFDIKVFLEKKAT